MSPQHLRGCDATAPPPHKHTHLLQDYFFSDNKMWYFTWLQRAQDQSPLMFAVTSRMPWTVTSAKSVGRLTSLYISVSFEVYSRSMIVLSLMGCRATVILFLFLLQWPHACRGQWPQQSLWAGWPPFTFLSVLKYTVEARSSCHWWVVVLTVILFIILLIRNFFPVNDVKFDTGTLQLI